MNTTYLDLAINKLEEIKATQGENITRAAQLIGNTLIAGKWVYTFGSGHSQLLAIELHGRAGGLYPIVHIPDPMNGKAERIEGFGEVLLKDFPFQAGETIIVISNSGRNPEPIEVALIAKQAGLKVIALTSLEHSRSVSSRHSSGKLLFEVADIVLDSLVPPGDASIQFEGMAPRTGALSTVLGAALLNAVTVEAIEYMLSQGVEPPVLLSANLDGSDEFNDAIKNKYGPMPSQPDI
ncbi:MAG: sugar isomerase domain-containing protein [Anaerolineaceae bacterium]|jgi:uncharacterized phosphosugar-binding protein